MNYKDWLAKYYAEDAATVAERGNRIEIIEHSLNKWNGLREDTRKSYGLSETDGLFHHFRCTETNDYVIAIDSSTCALCEYDLFSDEVGVSCSMCPIKQHSGNTCEEVYNHFTETGDADPMINLLQDTLKAEKEKQ